MRIDIRPSPAGALGNLKAVGVLKGIDLTWDLPAKDPSYRGAQVWVNTVNDLESGILIGTIAGNTYSYAADDTNSRYFWIRAVNEFDRSDGAFTGPATAAAKALSNNDVSGMVMDLSSANVVGQLANERVTGLGALAILNNVGVSRITGLGNLALQNTVNGSTQVTNLGDLAYADSIAANQIGAGTLAAGVIYAGTINASNILAGSMSADRVYGGTIRGTNINISGNFIINGSTGMGQLYTSNFTRCTGSNGDAPGLTAFNSTSSGSGAAITANYGSGVAIQCNGAFKQTAYSESSNQSTQTNNCIPVSSNTYNLGTFARLWMGIYSASAVVVSSDARTKTDIKDSDLGLDFINSLRPVSYLLKQGRIDISHAPEQAGPYPAGTSPEPHVIETSVAGKRRHYGLLAQEVKAVLGEKDAAMWVLEDPANLDSKQALRYEELISPLIKAVQELTSMVKAQQIEIDRLNHLVMPS